MTCKNNTSYLWLFLPSKKRKIFKITRKIIESVWILITGKNIRGKANYARDMFTEI